MSRRCSQHFQVISFHWEVGGPLGLSSIIFPNQPGALAGISTLSCIIPSTVHCRVQYGLYTQPSFLPPPFPYFHLRCWCITFLFLPPPSSCFPIFWMTNSVGSISRFANLPKVNPPPVNPPAIFSDFLKEQLRYFETPYYRSFHEHPTYGFYPTEGKLKDQVIFFEVLSLSDIFGIFWGRWDSGNVNIRREIQCFWPVRSNSSCDLWGRKVGWPPKTILSPEVTHTRKKEDVRGVMTTGLPDVE